VTYSNVEPIFEMVDMIGASRAYEANIAAFNSARGMIRSALSIGEL
jgi:flagellar basal-body rod protein FlgC